MKHTLSYLDDDQSGWTTTRHRHHVPAPGPEVLTNGATTFNIRRYARWHGDALPAARTRSSSRDRTLLDVIDAGPGPSRTARSRTATPAACAICGSCGLHGRRQTVLACMTAEESARERRPATCRDRPDGQPRHHQGPRSSTRPLLGQDPAVKPYLQIPDLPTPEKEFRVDPTVDRPKHRQRGRLRRRAAALRVQLDGGRRRLRRAGGARLALRFAGDPRDSQRNGAPARPCPASTASGTARAAYFCNERCPRASTRGTRSRSWVPASPSATGARATDPGARTPRCSSLDAHRRLPQRDRPRAEHDPTNGRAKDLPFALRLARVRQGAIPLPDTRQKHNDSQAAEEERQGARQAHEVPRPLNPAQEQ